MKGFSKINRGLILTLVVLLGVTAYLVAQGIIRKQDRVILNDLSTKYISAQVDYSMLPEKYRDDPTSISSEEFNAHIADMQKVIKGYFVDNEANYKYLIDDMTESLTQQALGNGVIHSYSKSNINIGSITFNRNTAVVQIENSTTIDKDPSPDDIYGYFMESDGEQTNEVTDTIEFQKVNGEWKITFAKVLNGVSGNDYYSELENLIDDYLI